MNAHQSQPRITGIVTSDYESDQIRPCCRIQPIQLGPFAQVQTGGFPYPSLFLY